MTVLLHLSDPHFGTENPKVVDAVLRFAAQQRPQVVVMSGDITQRARRAQFDAARRFTDELNIATTLVIPGNHDTPLFNLIARFLHPYANYCRAFGPLLEPTHESPELLILCLNTTRATRRKNGEVSSEQIERVADRLRQARREQLRIVVTHHPAFVTRPEDIFNLLRRRRMAVQTWAAAGADIVLGGHIHLPYVRALHESNLAAPRPMWIVQAGTAVSNRVRGSVPNSVNLLRYNAEGEPLSCVIERWDYKVSHDCFECKETTIIALNRDSAQ